MLTAVEPLLRTRGATTILPPRARSPKHDDRRRDTRPGQPVPPDGPAGRTPDVAGRHDVPGDGVAFVQRGRHEFPARTAGARRVASFLYGHLAFLAMAFIAVVGIVHLAASIDAPFGTWGDAAVVELMVRRAARFQQQLGPYSRFGWNHPGPVWFYLLAPFEKVYGTRGLFLGSWVLNMAAATCTVWVVRRRAGEWAARCAVAVLAIAMVSVPTFDLWNPWNPSALALPIVTAAVCAAATWQGSRLSFAGTVIASSFLVQTHVGMVPLGAFTVAMAAAGLVFGRRPGPDREAGDGAADGAARGTAPTWRRALWWTAAALAVGLMWAPPISQQIAATDDGGNASRLAAFAADPVARNEVDAGSPSTQQAFVALSRHLGSFPLGRDEWTAVPLDTAPLDAGRLLVAVGWLLLSLAVITFGWGRNRFATAAAAWTVCSYGVAFVAVMNITGPLHNYLLWWTAALPVPAVIGAGALVAPAVARSARSRRATFGADSTVRRHLGAVVGAIVAAVAVTLLALPVMSLDTRVRATAAEPFASEPAGEQAAAILVEKFPEFLADGVLVVPWSKAHPVGSSLVVALDRRGLPVSVAEQELFQFGELSRPTRNERIAVVISDPDDDPRGGLGPTAQQVARVGDGGRYVLWVVTR